MLAKGDVKDVASAARLVGQYVGRASGFATRLRMQADEMVNSARSVNPELRASTSALQAKLGQLRAVSYETRSTVSVRNFWQSHASSSGMGGSSTTSQSSPFSPGSPVGGVGWPTAGQQSSAASAVAAAAFASFSGADSSIAGSFLPSMAPNQPYSPGGQPGTDAGSSVSFSSAPTYIPAAGAAASPAGAPSAPFAMPSFTASGSAASGLGSAGMGDSSGIGGVLPGVSGGSLAEACLVREALLRHYMATQSAGAGRAGGVAPPRPAPQAAAAAASHGAMPPSQPQLK